MSPIFMLLLVGHLLGDFVFQTDGLVERKRRWGWMLFHSAVVTVVTLVLLGVFALHPQYFLLVFLIFFGHFLIDGIKRLTGRDGIYAFLVDQGAHVLVLAGIAMWLSTDFSYQSIVWFEWFGMRCVMILGYLGGMIAAVKVGSIVVEKAIAPIVEQVQDRIDNGLRNGGKWIGMLERALTFLLVTAGQFGAIGFLFAAKSILRFGEIKEPQQRKEAEYIIIGTFLSFGWALATGMLFRSWMGGGFSP